MAKRGWSLTDAQLTNLRETNFRESWGEHKRRQKLNPAARSAQAPRKPKPVSRPSPARIAERSGTDTISSGGGFYGDRQYYNRATYEQADISGSGRQPAYTPAARGGRGNYDDPTVPTRSMAGGHPRIDGGSDAVDSSKRRQASTQAAYRAADASMFNSTVTPKAKPVKDKRPRSRMSPDQNVFW